MRKTLQTLAKSSRLRQTCSVIGRNATNAIKVAFAVRIGRPPSFRDRGLRKHGRSSGSNSFSVFLIVQAQRVRRMVWPGWKWCAKPGGAPGPLVLEALVDLRMAEPYCTSMVMVWLAATSAWSFVAPVTVIWCVPLLRPLNVPVKPF
jgi:hypothetical protein